jgi:hypothetical protein
MKSLLRYSTIFREPAVLLISSSPLWLELWQQHISFSEREGGEGGGNIKTSVKSVADPPG